MGAAAHPGDRPRRSHRTEADTAKKKGNKEAQRDAEVLATATEAKDAEAGPPPKMKRKEYEREMAFLHGELVAMQEWVKASGAKICIVFERRDTAGKGGTIKRIVERAPWYIADTNNKRRGRLNIITHLLSQIPYTPLTPRDVTLPKRQPPRDYREPDLPLRRIPTPF